MNTASEGRLRPLAIAVSQLEVAHVVSKEKIMYLTIGFLVQPQTLRLLDAPYLATTITLQCVNLQRSP